MQIKNSHKVITVITFLVALWSLTAFKAMENIKQTQATSGSQTRTNSLYTGIRILMTGDKVEALRQFITGRQEAKE